MQEQIGKAANAAITTSVHGVKSRVSGRDIHVSGLANSVDEKKSIIASLNQVEGRRIVVDELEVLKKAEPYVFSGNKDGADFKYSGNVPRETMRPDFAKFISETSADGLTLAAGMPDDKWPGVVGKGVAALGELNSGSLEVSGRSITLKGVGENLETEARVNATLAALPDGYSADIDIELLNDGLPAEIIFVYTAASGGTVSGKAPAGFDMEKLTAALGVQKIGGQIKSSKDDGGDAIGAKFAAIGKWLRYFETAKISARADSLTVSGEVAKGTDLKSIAGSMSKELGESAKITLTPVSAVVADGKKRINAATGKAEIAFGGFWLESITFDVSREYCEQKTRNILENSTINFITGSASLGPWSIDAINQLAATLRHCLADKALGVEVGGHTDSQGDDAANLALSYERAKAVADALALRGIARQSMMATGYGETRPIADNNTKEGRANNRRTTFIWIQD
jgi:OOP family OmpA-OmpF porin